MAPLVKVISSAWLYKRSDRLDDPTMEDLVERGSLAVRLEYNGVLGMSRVLTTDGRRGWIMNLRLEVVR